MPSGVYKHKLRPPEVREKIRNTMREVSKTQGFKDARKKCVGKKRSAEFCKRISESRKKRIEKYGYINSPETRQKMSVSSMELKGEKSRAWKGGKSRAEIGRNWRNTVYGRLSTRVSNTKRSKKTKDLKIETVQKVYEDNIKEFGTCIYCFKKLVFGKDSLEHIIPLHRGGNNTYENLAVACRNCNSIKSARLLTEWFCGGKDNGTHI